MIRYDDLSSVSFDDNVKNSITLGKFDGVHRGHQQLFSLMRHHRREGENLLVFTFDMGMRSVLAKAEAPSLFTAEEKSRLLERQGVDVVVECPFTEEIRQMEPERFVEDILVKKLHVCRIVIGEDFHFGYQRRGNSALLAELATVYGYEFFRVDKVKEENVEIGSTWIRQELEAGHIEHVNDLLGFPYFMDAPVVHGRRIGRTIGFPTINQPFSEEKLCPRFGVYGTRIYVDGKPYRGLTNIGMKPTVDYVGRPLAESFLYDYEGDLYGKELHMELVSFVRPEQKFSSVEALKEQISKDKETVLQLPIL